MVCRGEHYHTSYVTFIIYITNYTILHYDIIYYTYYTLYYHITILLDYNFIIYIIYYVINYLPYLQFITLQQKYVTRRPTSWAFQKSDT
jgi:hypothetical protein